MSKEAGGDRKKFEEVSLGKKEVQVIQQLDSELEEYSALSQAAFDFLQDLLGLVPEMNIREMPPSLKVSTALVARLVNDLRCVALLAHRGYAVQACALAASTYEVAFALMSIGSDDGLAQKWIDHTEPTRSFSNVWDMTREGLRKLEIPDAQAAVEYRVYTQLCMVRHANPLIQMEHSFRVSKEGTVSPLIGPDALESARAAQYSLERSSALAFLAGTSFAKNQLESRLPAEVVSELVNKVKSIGSTMTTLKERAKARWGTEDPFPGKWRHMDQGTSEKRGGPTPPSGEHGN